MFPMGAHNQQVGLGFLDQLPQGFENQPVAGSYFNLHSSGPHLARRRLQLCFHVLFDLVWDKRSAIQHVGIQNRIDHVRENDLGAELLSKPNRAEQRTGLKTLRSLWRLRSF